MVVDDKLIQIKKNIKTFHEYWKDNNVRYHKFINFVFNTGLTEEDISKLMDLQKPSIEFNISEEYINRLRGEFAKHEPSLNVRGADGLPVELLTESFIAQMETVEGIIRQIFFGGKSDSLKYRIYTDQLCGGFSVAKVCTDYVNPRSFEQNIYVERAFDPTLCGFDPMARETHKGDGEFCFEIIPMIKADFEQKFGKEAANQLTYTRTIDDYNWSYTDNQEKIALVAYYYEKVKKNAKIVKLTNGHTIVKKHYEQLKEMWQAKGFIEQMPQVIDERNTTLEYIDRYLVCEKGILEHVSTDYCHLPLVFFDGNSQLIKKEPQAPTKQMTRPYIYNAYGLQKFINFCGQTLAADIEGMVTHKFKVALESIPEKYMSAYTNPQLESVLIYNAFDEKHPEKMLPPPQEIVRTPIPPVVQEMFLNGPKFMQSILGAYDGEIGSYDNPASGKAIEKGSIASSSAAYPYMEGFINGLNRVGQIIIDLIPKYYVTPRTIPVIRPNGTRDFVEVNKPEGLNDNLDPATKDKVNVHLLFDPYMMQIQVESGVGSSVEKHVALEQLINLMQASPLFAQFMNEDGLLPLLDNLEIRGIENLKKNAEKYMNNLKQAAQQGDQTPPEEALIQAQVEVEREKTQQRAQEAEMKHQISEQELQIKVASDAAEKAIEREKINLELIKLLSELQVKERKDALEEERQQREESREALKELMEAAKIIKEKNATNNIDIE